MRETIELKLLTIDLNSRLTHAILTTDNDVPNRYGSVPPNEALCFQRLRLVR